VFFPSDPSGHKQLLNRSEDIAAKQRAASERQAERKPTLAEELAEAKKLVQPPASKTHDRKRDPELA
jgi:hypothetical protein